MNQIPHKEEEKKSPLMKTAAVLLFVLVIIICAWAAVRLAMFIPTGFTKLADLADTVHQYDPMTDAKLEMSASEEAIESGSIVSLDWNDLNIRGDYSFSYECIDGVSIDVRVAGEIEKLDCEKLLYIPTDTFDLDVYISSEKSQVAYVPMTLEFTPNSGSANLDDEAVVTVTNSDIPDRITEREEGETTETEPTTTTTPTEPVVTWRYVEPTSNPNGYTDFQVTYLGVGIVNSNGVFVPTTLRENQAGAFKFIVKNIGTKTSSTWNFEGELPNGTDFESGDQTGLRPTESATFTISFPNTGDDGVKHFGVKVYGGNDIKTANNSFTATVDIR